MKSSWPSLPLTIAVLAGVAGAASSGCGSEETSSTIDPGAEPVGHQTVAQYVMHVQPSRRKATLHRLSAKAAALIDARGPGMLPQAVTDAVLSQDDITGSNGGSTTNNTVELVTGNVYDLDAANCGTAATFCADVTLNSFWTKTLNFAYAQVTAITDANGQPLSGHGPISSGTYTTDSAPTGASGGLGGWLHTSDSLQSTQFGGKPTGAMLPYNYGSGGGANGGTRRWVFANPDDADTYIQLKVWGTTTYTNYGLATATVAAPDACSTTTGTPISISVNGIIQLGQPLHGTSNYTAPIPFAFTHYATTYAANTNIVTNRRVNFTFGATAPDTSGTNSTLPKTTAPHPAVFPWWDSSVWASSGGTTTGLCAKQTGTAPNRKMIITWKKIGGNTNGPYMTVHATLVEGSDQIWFNYTDSITGSGPAWSSNIGTQNEAGTVGVSQTFTAFPTSTSYVLTPKP